MKKRTFSLMLVMLLMGCIPLLSFAAFSYNSVIGPMRDKQYAYNMQSLAQNATAIDRILYNTSIAMDYFINMGIVQEAMLMEMNGKDFQTYQKLKNELIRLQPFDSMQANACLINIRKGWLINNSGLYRTLEAESSTQYQTYIDQGYVSQVLTYYPKENASDAAVYDSFFNDAAVHMLKSIPQGSYHGASGMLMVKIPYTYFSQILVSQSHLGDMLVLDDSWRVLADDKGMRIGENIADMDYIRKISQLDYDNGSFDLRSDTLGEISIAFRHSDYADWTYVLMSSNQNMVEELYRLTMSILLFCCVFFFLLLIGSIVMSRRTYKPISSILNNLSHGNLAPELDPFQYITASIGDMSRRQQELIAQLSSQEQPIREYATISLLQGTLNGEHLERRRSTLAGVHDNWVKAVAVVRPHPNILDENLDSAGILMASVRQTAEEAMSQYLALPLVIISNMLCAIFAFPEEMAMDLKKHVNAAANQLLRLLDRNDEGLSIVGIGRPFYRLEDANRSYQEALSAVSSSMFFSGETVVFSDETALSHTFRPKVYLQTQSKLITALNSADESGAEQYLDQMMEDIASYTRNESMIPLLSLLTELIAMRQEIAPDYVMSSEGAGFVYADFMRCASRKEMRVWLLEKMMLPYMVGISKLYSAQQRQIAKRVQQIIEEGFDKGITLESCAKEMNYHPGHIRKIFQQVMGVSFYDSLNQRRMDAAKDWLVSTDMKIQVIAEKLDYSNSQNFIRYFRAYTGETPGNYRKINQSLMGKHDRKEEGMNT